MIGCEQSGKKVPYYLVLQAGWQHRQIAHEAQQSIGDEALGQLWGQALCSLEHIFANHENSLLATWDGRRSASMGIYNSVKLTQGADIHVNNGACYSSNGSGFSSGKSLDGDMNKKLCEKTKATDCACLLCQKTPPRGHPFRLHNLLPLNNETSCCRKGTPLLSFTLIMSKTNAPLADSPSVKG